jgi:cytochrome c oxidase subunit II
MAAEAVGQGPADASGPNHGLRIFIIWLPIAIIADWLLYFVYGPHMPPGRMSTSAASQQFDIKVMSVMAAPIMAFVLVYGVYAMIVWRHKEGDDADGPPIYGHTRIQATWITVTSVIVLCLAGFGTYELASPGFAGAGAGEGSRSRSSPSSGGLPTATRSSGASRPPRSCCRSTSRSSST